MAGRSVTRVGQGEPVAASDDQVASGVSAQDVAQHAMNRSDELFSSAVEALDEGVLVQDDHGRVVRANSSAYSILGLETQDFAPLLDRDRRWHTIRPDGSEFPTADFPGRQSLIQSRPIKGTLIGIVNPADEVRWLLVNAFPVDLGDERLVVSTFTDVTEQRQTTEALRESEQRFRMLSASAPIGIFITDGADRIIYANPELQRQTGLTEAEILVIRWNDVIHKDDHESVGVELGRFFDSEHPYLVEHRIVRPDGSICWVRARLARMTNASGEAVGLVGTAADITDFVAADAKLRESEERTRAILESAAEGIISTDGSGLVLEFNAAAERILGYDSDEVVGKLFFYDLLAPEIRPMLMKLFEEFTEGAPPRFVGEPASEVPFVDKYGSIVATELAVTQVLTSEGLLFTGVLHDISERKSFEAQLEHQATHDALTGLPNRALLVAELEAALNRASRRRRGVGVLFVELGRTQLITDSLGHRAGDQLVIEAARRLVKTVGGAGTVTRFGGDHFVVFAEDLDDVGDAVELAVELIAVLEERYVVASEEAFIKTSVGIAFAVQGFGTAESLISNADVAMKRVRLDASASFEVFDTEMRQWVDSRRKLENAMRHGIERGEFELYYQPVVKVSTGGIKGFEALVRWNHPELGLLPPIEFIPLAEDSGLIVALGELLLRNACRQLAAWQRAYPDRNLSVSVNLSGRQLELPDLAATVASALMDAGADPKGLDLEITETVLLDDVESAATTLDGLKKIGINLVVDDFGTGYSSLTYLCRFPIDVVKVDKSFVSQIGTGSRDASIVSVVVGLAQTLEMDVVAEGVETLEQLALLEDLECSYAQGYLFSKARPVAEAEKLLEQRPLLASWVPRSDPGSER